MNSTTPKNSAGFVTELSSPEKIRKAYDMVNDTRHFLVRKINRFGFKQKRLIWFNKDDLTFHVTNLTLKSHKIHKLKAISHFIKRNDRKVSIQFDNDINTRDLHVVFDSALELYEFNELAGSMSTLLQETQFKTRKSLIFTHESDPGNIPGRNSRKYT